MSTFALDVAKFAELAGEQSEQAVKKAAIDMFGDVVKATPVDTGRAKGNWQATLDTPFLGVSEAVDPTGGGALADITATVSGAEMGGTLFLSNNLPYIQKLEYGSSAQAPQGMVRLNVERWQQLIDNAVRAT